MTNRTANPVRGMTAGPFRLVPAPVLPVHGQRYTCPLTGHEMIVDGVVVEGNVYWYGCHACQCITMEDGRVLACEKSWHCAIGEQP